MSIKKRYIIIEEKECHIHLPVKPNGYAILILGDRNHFVNKEESLWTQHPARKMLMTFFLEKGYTIFYAEQDGAHWGNDQLFSVLERLVHHVRKTEIINEHIHIFAEGMGALLALRFLKNAHMNIRSAVLFNPCLYLSEQYELEKKNKFYYRKFIKEIRNAYGIAEKEVESLCKNQTNSIQNMVIRNPVKVFQAIYQAPYPSVNHIQLFSKKKEEIEKEVLTTFFVPGKTIDQFKKPICKFYGSYEGN
ncbi:hypothetical protein ACERII_00815 [Evansella sp. AB-rgal1]|uniref:hypothetical protein n=1 Tax=Evansella sp. AB-rgal1 TaxID=3242696 RepID=UPI00359DEC38